MELGISDYDMGFKYEGLKAMLKTSALELDILKTETQMQKMLSSPFAEALDRHEAMVVNVISPPALDAIQKQQNIIDNLSLITNIIPAELQTTQFDRIPSQPLLESIALSLRDVPTYNLAESAINALNFLDNGIFERFALIDNAIIDLVDRIPKINPAIFEAADQVCRITNGFADSFLKGLSSISNAISKVDFSPLFEIHGNLSYIADFEDKNEVLNGFGWYLISELPERIVDEIYERRDEITQDEVDTLIVQYFRNNRCQELKNIVKRWRHLPYFEARKAVFHEAQVCHSRRLFNASTTTISLHFEGVVTDFVRDRFMAPTYNKWATKALKRINELTDDLTMAAMPMEDWIICSYVLACVHKYLQSTITPQKENTDRDSYSVIGALIRRSCVCEGFAKAYKLLCDYLRIASIVVSGEATRDGKREAHAWNITRIKDVTAHTDITWDTIGGIGSYDYFNLCDADIAADHSFDTALYPKCAPNKINYFYKNSLIAANEDEAKRIISKNTDKDFFSVKLLFPTTQERLGGLGFPSGKLRFNDMQNVVMFTK